MGMANNSRNITALNNSFFDLIKLDDKLMELRNENKTLQNKVSEIKECPTCPLDHEYNKVINCEKHVHEIELLKQQLEELKHNALDNKCPTCPTCPLDHEYNKVINCEKHVHEIELLKQQLEELKHNECPTCPKHIVAINESNIQLNDTVTKYNKLKLKHEKSKQLIKEDDEKIDDANNKAKHIREKYNNNKKDYKMLENDFNALKNINKKLLDENNDKNKIINHQNEQITKLKHISEKHELNALMIHEKSLALEKRMQEIQDNSTETLKIDDVEKLKPDDPILAQLKSQFNVFIGGSQK
jgi:DNA repair exonuclease SbcCD ATPase subunit